MWILGARIPGGGVRGEEGEEGEEGGRRRNSGAGMERF